jgi:hypothetical protein
MHLGKRQKIGLQKGLQYVSLKENSNSTKAISRFLFVNVWWLVFSIDPFRYGRTSNILEVPCGALWSR